MEILLHSAAARWSIAGFTKQFYPSTQGSGVVEVSAIGGAKKKSMAQMEKTQVQQDKEEAAPKKAKGKPGPVEKKVRAVELQRTDDQRVINEISKMSAITPYLVSSQFNIRLGTAKDLLEELEKRRILRSVGGNARIRIYRTVAA